MFRPLAITGVMAQVFALLCLIFNSVKDGRLVFSGIPFAMRGGVPALCTSAYRKAGIRPS